MGRRVGTAPARVVGALALLASACGGDDDRPATWAYIFPAIVQPGCATAGCHSAIAAQGGVRLDHEEGGYIVLVGAWGPDGRNYVVPGDPARSRLLYLLRAQDTARMPPDGALPDADVALIERWILEGARVR